METHTELGFLSTRPASSSAPPCWMLEASWGMPQLGFYGGAWLTQPPFKKTTPPHKGTFISYLSLQTRIHSSGEDNNKKIQCPCPYFLLKCFDYITFYQQAIVMCYYYFKIKLIRSWSFNILLAVGMDLFSGYFSLRWFCSDFVLLGKWWGSSLPC